ncbi:MAG TPA: hypothetical protein VGJ60_06815 [Chloroflexota bacterium]|jgi:hypothetical protein
MVISASQRRQIERTAANLGAELLNGPPLAPTPPPRQLLPAPRVPRGGARQEGPWMLERSPDGSARVRANLHPGQSAAMASRARTIAMIAGSQSGKTSSGPLWLEREIRLQGPGDYLAVTATFPLLKRKMLPEFLRLFQGTLNLGTWMAADKMFVFHDNQTRVLFGSATNPESLESATAKAAWLDEAGQAQFRLESYEAIDRRLALYEGRRFISTTPYNQGPLFTTVYKPAVDGDPDICVIQFASSLNPSFPIEEMERQRDKLPLWKYRMFFEGRFDKPPGLIYSDYEDSYREQGGHLIKARTMPIPAWWPRYIGLDFGGVHLARIFIAQDPLTNTFYVYDEQLSGGRTASQHAQDILQQLGGAPLYRSWGGAKSEDSWRLEFTAAGLVVEPPPVSDVEVGIDRAIELFKARRLFVFDTCVGLRSELGTYSRKAGPDGEPLEDIQDKAAYHRCVTAGTLIETRSGLRPIEQIRPGELVRTRQGFRRVLDSALTERQAKVLTLELSDGRKLTATPEHPIWVRKRGWVRMDALRYAMAVECSPSRPQPANTSPRWSSSRASPTGATRKRKMSIAATTSTPVKTPAAARGISTSPSGKTRPDRSSLKAGWFITTTTTHSTTTPRISNRCRKPSTTSTTSAGRGQVPRGWRIWSEFVRRPWSGTAQRLVWRGTPNMLEKLGRSVRQPSAAVSSAARASSRSRGARAIASVATRASRVGGGPAASTTRRARVPGADNPSRRTGTHAFAIARAVVRARPGCLVVRVVRETEPRDVFNLTVEGEHEYFANGILVSNCDALRYLCSGLSGPQQPLPVLAMGRARGWQPRY